MTDEILKNDDIRKENNAPNFDVVLDGDGEDDNNQTPIEKVDRIILKDLITGDSFSWNTINDDSDISKKDFVSNFGPLFGNNVAYSDILSNSSLRETKIAFCQSKLIDEIQYILADLQENDPDLANRVKSSIKAFSIKTSLIGIQNQDLGLTLINEENDFWLADQGKDSWIKVLDNYEFEKGWIDDQVATIKESEAYHLGGIVNHMPDHWGMGPLPPLFLAEYLIFDAPVKVETSISFNTNGTIRNFVIFVSNNTLIGEKPKSIAKMVEEQKIPILRQLVFKFLWALYNGKAFSNQPDREYKINETYYEWSDKRGYVYAYPNEEHVIEKNKSKIAYGPKFSNAIIKKETVQIPDPNWYLQRKSDFSIDSVISANFNKSKWSEVRFLNYFRKDGTFAGAPKVDSFFTPHSTEYTPPDRVKVWKEHYNLINLGRMVLEIWEEIFFEKAAKLEDKSQISISRDEVMRRLLDGSKYIIRESHFEYAPDGTIEDVESGIKAEFVLPNSDLLNVENERGKFWVFSIPAFTFTVPVGGAVGEFAEDINFREEAKRGLFINPYAIELIISSIESSAPLRYVQKPENIVNATKYIPYYLMDEHLKRLMLGRTLNRKFLSHFILFDKEGERLLKEKFNKNIVLFSMSEFFKETGLSSDNDNFDFNLKALEKNFFVAAVENTLFDVSEQMKNFLYLFVLHRDAFTLFSKSAGSKSNSSLFMLFGLNNVINVIGKNINFKLNGIEYNKVSFRERILTSLRDRDEYRLVYSLDDNDNKNFFISNYFDELARSVRENSEKKITINPDLTSVHKDDNKIFAVFRANNFFEKDEAYTEEGIAESAHNFDELSEPENFMEFLIAHGKETLFRIDDPVVIEATSKLLSFNVLEEEQLSYIMSDDFEKDWTKDFYYKFNAKAKTYFEVPKEEVVINPDGSISFPFKVERHPILDVDNFRENIVIPINALDDFAISNHAKLIAGVTSELRTISSSYQSILDINKDNAKTKTEQIGALITMYENINASLSDLEDSYITGESVSPSQRRISRKGRSLITKFDTSLKDPFLILINWKERARQKISKMRYLNFRSASAKDFEKVIANISVPTFDWDKVREIFANLFSKLVKLPLTVMKRSLSAFAIFDNLANIIETLRYPFKMIDVKFGKIVNSEEGDKYLAIFPLPKDLIIQSSLLANGTRTFFSDLSLSGGTAKRVKICKIYVPELKAFFNSVVFIVDERNKEVVEKFSALIIRDSSMSELSKFLSILNGVKLLVDPEFTRKEENVAATVMAAQAIATGGSAAVFAKNWLAKAVAFVLGVIASGTTNAVAAKNYYNSRNATISDYLVTLPEEMKYLSGYIKDEEVLITSLSNVSSLPLSPAYVVGSVLAQATAILGGFATSIMIGALIGGVINTITRNYKLIHRAVLIKKDQKQIKKKMAEEITAAINSGQEEAKKRENYDKLSFKEKEEVTSQLIKEKKEVIKLKYLKENGGLAFMNNSQILGMARFQNFLAKSRFTPWAFNTVKNISGKLVKATGVGAVLGSKALGSLSKASASALIKGSSSNSYLKELKNLSNVQNEFDDSNILDAIHALSGIF